MIYPLQANASSSESTPTGDIIDILSNGFKVRGSGGGINSNNANFIYMAIMDGSVGGELVAPATAV